MHQFWSPRIGHVRPIWFARQFSPQQTVRAMNLDLGIPQECLASRMSCMTWRPPAPSDHAPAFLQRLPTAVFWTEGTVR